MKKNDEGIVGIGTLIVFIAMVLVAAIAAAVIINTASQLQQAAVKTTQETVHDLGIGIQVKKVYGEISAGRKIMNLFIYFELNPGAESLDLTNVMVAFQTQGTGNDKLANLLYADSTDAGTPDGMHYYVYDQGTAYNGTQIGGLDPNNGYDDTINKPILDQDGLLVARIATGTPGVGTLMPQNSHATISFMPSGGGSTGICEFRVPGSFDQYKWVELW
jgi:flagellin FlaB